jgi:hypothetical protein
MIALDTTALSLLFVENSIVHSPATGKPIKHARDRLEFLIERISQDEDAILIPTPTLAEILVKTPPDKIDELLKRLKTSPWFRVEAFDAAAAVELGMRTARAIAAKDKWEGLQADHTKIKFDRQIVSVAIVNGATEIISDDRDVWAICERWNFPAHSVESLPLPPALIPPPLLASLEEDGAE